VLEAAQGAAAGIRAAGRTSPSAGQGWLAEVWAGGPGWLSARAGDLRGWVAEHAGGLRTLAKVLRWVGMALVAVGAAVAAISLVAGFFSVGTGWLGEVPAGALVGWGMVLWGAGDALDTTVDWAEGRISGREFAFRAGFAVGTAFAGGLAVKLGGKVLDKLAPELAGKLRRWIDNIITPGLADERGSVGVPGRRSLPDVDHAHVRQLIDQRHGALHQPSRRLRSSPRNPVVRRQRVGREVIPFHLPEPHQKRRLRPEHGGPGHRAGAGSG
jgi:hypothetical protein